MPRLNSENRKNNTKFAFRRHNIHMKSFTGVVNIEQRRLARSTLTS